MLKVGWYESKYAKDFIFEEIVQIPIIFFGRLIMISCPSFVLNDPFYFLQYRFHHWAWMQCNYGQISRDMTSQKWLLNESDHKSELFRFLIAHNYFVYDWKNRYQLEEASHKIFCLVKMCCGWPLSADSKVWASLHWGYESN